MNKIIIVGGDHHNGLNLARIFGLNGYEVICYVVSDCKKSFVEPSRFISQFYKYSTETEAFDSVLKNYSDLDEKAFLIPYSDGAAMELDNRLDEFKEIFFVPSINHTQGEISKLMDKKTQYEWAIANGIKMAESLSLNLLIPQKLPFSFPVILKPEVSALGEKGDIVICDNEKAYLEAIEDLKIKGYKSVVVQPYLTVDYEIDVFGCVCRNKDQITLFPTKTIRQWPLKKGTNCFSQTIIEESVVEKCKNIIYKLKDIGFDGLYDAELLVINNEVLLNEFNFRNSGDDYMVLSQNYFYPLVWVDDILGREKPYSLPEKPSVDNYSMTFFNDYQQVRVKSIKFSDWLRDVGRTSDFALWYKKDFRPVFRYYWNGFAGKIKRLIHI